MQTYQHNIVPASLILKNFSEMGLKKGDTVLVHSSLSKIGWVPGGAQAVFQCLIDAVGPEGTIVVPSFTSENTDPSRWQNPPVPKDWWPIIRQEMSAFDPKKTPSRHMGAIAEVGRCWPGAKRSNHPTNSFSAVGAMADKVVQVHDLVSGLGDESPLRTLESMNAKVLLLGVEFENCTCFHLAEYRTANKGQIFLEGSAILVDGDRKWIEYGQLEVDSDDFERIGAEFVGQEKVTVGNVGKATCYVFHLSQAVEFARKWMDVHRNAPSL